MKATAVQSIDRTHQLIKTTVLLMVTILFLTGGTAYARHRHYDSNRGASIIFGDFYYPETSLYHKAYRQPRHYRYYNDYYYRDYYSHFRPWRGRHNYKIRRKHYNGYRDD